MSEEMILMPRELTAENGAKWLLMGEFKEVVTVPCSECEGAHEDICEDDDDAEICEMCGGAGDVPQEAPVSWTTIKDIYAKCVKHFESKGE